MNQLVAMSCGFVSRWSHGKVSVEFPKTLTAAQKELRDFWSGFPHVVFVDSLNPDSCDPVSRICFNWLLEPQLSVVVQLTSSFLVLPHSSTTHFISIRGWKRKSFEPPTLGQLKRSGSTAHGCLHSM